VRTWYWRESAGLEAEFCGGGFAKVEPSRVLTPADGFASNPWSTLTFTNSFATAAVRPIDRFEMTRSKGSTVTPLTKEGSSAVVGESPVVLKEEVKGKDATIEYLSVLLQQETTLYLPCEDYLTGIRALPSSSSSMSSADADPVSESWRRKLCEWSFEVVDHFKVRTHFGSL
jgi:hypothetical protein